MRSLRLPALAAILATAALAAAPGSATASFGFLGGSEGFDAALLKQDGTPETRAGSHPYSFRIGVGLQMAGAFSDGDLRDLRVELPAGLLLNPTAVPECLAADFNRPRVSPYEESRSGESCPDTTQVGVLAVKSNQAGGETRHFGLFNLSAPHGRPLAFGASPYGVPVVFTARVREADAGLTLGLTNLPQAIDVQRLQIALWGTPWEYAHDAERGNCLNETDPAAPHGVAFTPGGPGGVPPFVPGTCTVGKPPFLSRHSEATRSYLTAPPAPCGSPPAFTARARSWQGASAVADDTAAPLIECKSSVARAQVRLTTEAAAVGTGLAFSISVSDGGGIVNPGGIARPAVREAVVSLPEGLTVNPSVAAGLGACSEAAFAAERLTSAPGAGCPNDSKVGEVRIEGMLGLSEPIAGSLYIAEPHRNPFGTLLALYVLARDPERGIFVSSAGKVEPDPRTGRLVVTFQDLPRLLYTRFDATLREGQRAMLVSPPACGAYPSQIRTTSWAPSDPPNVEVQSFAISTGAAGGGCPAPGAPPFSPGLSAGSMNQNAAAYTPVHLRMTRTDAEQEIVSYGAKLPPGLLAKIAGASLCPEAAIAAAKAKSAAEELASPSCPANSKIGTTMVGGGVGGTLAWAPGALYLAGAHAGAPLSVVAVTAAKIGPFDLGTVVVRAVPRFDSGAARLAIDAAASDPIPHILAGVPLHVRDIRVRVDRPQFTLNPSSCEPFRFTSVLGGAGADPFSRSDDSFAETSTPFQLLNCSALGFKPRLSLRMTGASRQAGYPGLRAVYVPRAGDANLRSAGATLPRAFFLEQAHIRSICSNTQFRADACPPSSIYGYAKAFTPLLAEPLQGPIYLRSSTHRLPDLVADLQGLVDVEIVGRIDSSKGGLRARFENLPDAPVTKFVLRMKGGKKGLIVNSRDLCRNPSRADAGFLAQNNKAHELRPAIKAQCGKGRGKKKQRR